MGAPAGPTLAIPAARGRRGGKPMRLRDGLALALALASCGAAAAAAGARARENLARRHVLRTRDAPGGRGRALESHLSLRFQGGSRAARRLDRARASVVGRRSVSAGPGPGLWRGEDLADRPR